MRTQWPGRAVKRPVQLTCGPSTLFDFLMIFNLLNFEMYNGNFFMFKIHQILQGDRLKHREQLSLLANLKIPSGFQVTNSGINSNLNFPWILKRFNPFWKNLINSLKFHLHKMHLNIILHWLSYIQILEVSLQVVQRTVYFILIRASHLRILLSLSHVYHCSKLGKEYSKLTTSIVLPSSGYAYPISQNRTRYEISKSANR
jgi:hypothetical protein